MAEESDTGTDPGSEELKEDKRRIVLCHGEQTVHIEGPDDLETIAKTAAYFWLLVSPPHQVKLGFTAGSGLVTERAEPYREAGEEVSACA